MIRRRESGLYEAESLDDVRAEYPWNHRRHFGGSIARGLSIAAGFSPTQFSGCKLYLRADTGVTLNSGNVSAWSDLSGTGATVSQGTAGSQPPFVSNWRNGRAAVQGASGKFLAGALALAQVFTIYMVGEYATGGATQIPIWGGAAGTADLRVSAGVPGISAGGVVTGGTLANGAAFFARGEFNGGSSTSNFYPHGGSVQSASGNAGTAGFTSLAVLDAPGFSGTWSGKAALFLVYNRILSTAEKAVVERWIRSTWFLF